MLALHFSPLSHDLSQTVCRGVKRSWSVIESHGVATNYIAAVLILLAKASDKARRSGRKCFLPRTITRHCWRRLADARTSQRITPRLVLLSRPQGLCGRPHALSSV